MANETFADIIAEMRFHGQQNIDAEKDKPEYGILTVEGRITQNYANRIEAANDRQMAGKCGNAAAMREALERVLAAYKSGAIHTCAECCRDEWDDELGDLKASVEAALAAPPRNCDRFQTADAAWDAWMHGPGCRREGEGFVGLLDWLYAK